MNAVSPLAPATFPDLPAVGGVRLAVLEAGLRYHGRPDLFLAELAPETTVAGVFTSSQCASAPVDWCRRVLPAGSARAVVCNAGNANAFTGSAGDVSAKLTADVLGEALGIHADQVFLASTGVIGEPLNDAALRAALPKLAAAADAGWDEAADAIRTTDTFAKAASAAVTVGETTGNIVGIAKGSGMIAPDMATMLGFVFTDLAVTAEALQHALAASTRRSYNRITVDSDTSTSDTVLLFATGAAGNLPVTGPESPEWTAFVAALDQVNLDLAHQIVKDGEGATKFVSVTVTGAQDEDSARRIAMAIGNSPLVKTALAAEDANWGRIVMAVGKAGEPAERDRLAIWFGDVQITAEGQVLPGYNEDDADVVLAQPDIPIRVDVGVGDGEATIWTCDLTHGYIDINAGYRS